MAKTDLNEERLRALVTATSDVIYSLSADWRIMRELDGRGFLKDTHEPITDWQSRNIYPEDLEKVQAAIAEAIQEKKIFQLEHRVWRADGTPGWTFSRAVPILDTKGEIIEWFGAASDITERKQAENALQQQKRLYETITASTPDLMYVFDVNYRFTYANSALLAMWGKTWDNAVGKSLLENGYETWHAEMHEREIDQVKATKQPIRGEVSFPHATLGKRVYDYIFTPVLDQHGEVEAIAGTTRDVTDRKHAEELVARSAEEVQAINEELAATNEEMVAAQELLEQSIANLTESEERYRTSEARLDQVIDQLPASITLLIGPDFVIERTNPSNLAYWQKKAADVIGKPLLEALPELADQAFPGQLKQVLETGESIFEEEHPVMLQAPDGTLNVTYVDYSYQPLCDQEGRRAGVLVMSNDVTEKVESRQMLEKYAVELLAINEEVAAANEELQATNAELFATQVNLQNLLDELAVSEKKYRNEQIRLARFFMQAPAGICVLDGRELRFELINPLYQQIFPDRDVLGKPMLEALPEIEDSSIWGILQEVYDTGKTFEGKELLIPLARTDDGPVENRYFDFIYQARLNEHNQVDGILVFATEVTSSVQTKLELQRAEQMLRLAIDAAGIGTWQIELQTKALKYNSVLANLFGYEGLIPMTYEQAIGQVSADFRKKIVAEIEKAITSGQEYDITYSQYRFNDGKLIWLRSLGKISADEQGNYTIFSGVVMDITEQKADEQRKNDFIGMVSHELKTPLTSLTAIVQVANNKLKNSEDQFLAGAMEKANIHVKKMSNIINGFLNVSRLESGKIQIIKKDFALDELIKEIIKEHELTMTTHIIELNLCDHMEINADRDKIGSVITNLLSNAVKYSPKDKQIKVTCHLSDAQVQVSVEDQGMGIKPEDLDHVFDRYFRAETTHTKHISGFGIGLYLSAEIIKQHDGKIWVESEVDKGSGFYFSLPM